MRPAGGLRLGSIGGIEITVDWSLLIIFFLITFSLAAGIFPAWHPDWSPELSWITALALSESHLRFILKSWIAHYNGGRPHQSSVGCVTNILWRRPACDRIIAD